MKDKHCGRLGEHPSHDWKGMSEVDFWLRFVPRRKVTYWCDGRPIIEGGHRGFNVRVDV